MSQKRQSFTLQQKLEILAAVDSGIKKKRVAEKYGIAQTTLSTFLKDRAKIEKMAAKINFGPNRMRVIGSCVEDVELQVFSWYQEQRSQDNVVRGPEIQAKARELAKLMGYNGFLASNGWLDRFRVRYKIKKSEQESSSSVEAPEKIIATCSPYDLDLFESDDEDNGKSNDTMKLNNKTTDPTISEDNDDGDDGEINKRPRKRISRRLALDSFENVKNYLFNSSYCDTEEDHVKRLLHDMEVILLECVIKERVNKINNNHSNGQDKKSPSSSSSPNQDDNKE